MTYTLEFQQSSFLPILFINHCSFCYLVVFSRAHGYHFSYILLGLMQLQKFTWM
uniref:Uncharacterized protein n=1 Tax=Arundo donax TaxID=35708 RepID=A0A0A9DLD8_ARUDO